MGTTTKPKLPTIPVSPKNTLIPIKKKMKLSKSTKRSDQIFDFGLISPANPAEHFAKLNQKLRAHREQ